MSPIKLYGTLCKFIYKYFKLAIDDIDFINVLLPLCLLPYNNITDLVNFL